MKNFRNLIVLFLAINLIKCDDNGEDTLCTGSAKSINDCNDLLSDVEKSENKHCCFFSGTGNDESEYKQCRLLDNDEYNNLEDTKSQLIYEGTYSSIDIDCNSLFIEISFFLLFLLSIFSF